MTSIVAIVCIFVILPGIIFGTVSEMKKAKYAAQKGDGLRASELKQIIRDAVEAAVVPLEDRIASLEDALSVAGVTIPEPESQPLLDPALLADDLESDVDEDLPAAVGRRMRA